MSIKICPVCLEVTQADATRCSACGASLRGGDTVPAALYMPADKPSPGLKTPTPGAVWFDDLKRPAPPVDLPLAITLRDVVPEAPPRPQPPATTTTGFPPILTADPDAPSPLSDEELARRSVVDQLAADRATRAAAKAAKRAAVRRARLGLGAYDTLPAAGEATVLVYDEDGAGREQLVALLDAFGFQVRATADIDEAITLAKTVPFVAAFVDVVLDSSDGGAGVDLCQRLKRNDLHADGRITALALVCAQERPSDRVLARMAGCDASLVKPLTRGSVARQLESCNVALPADARRATR